MAGRGELEQEVAPVGGVVSAVEQTGDDQAIKGPRRVRRMHAHAFGDRGEVERPRLATITSNRSCGGVTTSSTAATERALTPMSARGQHERIHIVCPLDAAPLCTQRLRNT